MSLISQNLASVPLPFTSSIQFDNKHKKIDYLDPRCTATTTIHGSGTGLHLNVAMPKGVETEVEIGFVSTRDSTRGQVN